jgi:hypothetical protein
MSSVWMSIVYTNMYDAVALPAYENEFITHLSMFVALQSQAYVCMHVCMYACMYVCMPDTNSCLCAYTVVLSVPVSAVVSIVWPIEVSVVS